MPEGTSVGRVLCLASYEKGADLMRECARQGVRVILLTTTSLEGAHWPAESIDETFYMPDLSRTDEVIRAVSYLARSRSIDLIIPLDDYDVEMAAGLREHLRLPGMGTTVARRFRDKLAMRATARDAGILVPDFVHVLNHERIREYMERVPPPWVLKPRSEVSTIGIAKVESPEELWQRVEALGDRQSYFLLERYVAGEVCHVDSLSSEGEVVFAEAHQYGRPPLDVFHGGGLHMTRTLPRDSEDAQALRALNRQVLAALGLVRGAAHMEYIKGRDDGRLYFLEVGARVGGANTAELVEAATGVNLWVEWAKIEIGQGERVYHPPQGRDEYAGIIISLARQERPDTSAYTEQEIVWRLDKRHHVGFIVAAPDPGRVQELLDGYSQRFYVDFHASLPPWTGRPESHVEPAASEG